MPLVMKALRLARDRIPRGLSTGAPLARVSSTRLTLWLEHAIAAISFYHSCSLQVSERRAFVQMSCLECRLRVTNVRTVCGFLLKSNFHSKGLLTLHTQAYLLDFYFDANPSQKQLFLSFVWKKSIMSAGLHGDVRTHLGERDQDPSTFLDHQTSGATEQDAGITGHSFRSVENILEFSFRGKYIPP